MQIYEVVAAGVLGLIFGSFATAAAYRIPRGESIVTGRSKCPNCGATVTAVENVPVVSYLLLRGRCRHCGEPISGRYPLTEVATGVLFALSVWEFDVSLRAAVYAGFFWVLVVLTVIDLEHGLLPDRLVFPSLVVGGVGLAATAIVEDRLGNPTAALGFAAAVVVAILVSVLLPPRSSEEDEQVEAETGPRRRIYLPALAFIVPWMLLVGLAFAAGEQRGVAGSVIGAAVFSGFFWVVASAVPGGMGGGDVKLALLLGSFVGYIEAPGLILVAMFLAFVSGTLIGAIPMLLRGGSRTSAVPFGPFLALGSALAIFVGEDILDAYLGAF